MSLPKRHRTIRSKSGNGNPPGDGGDTENEGFALAISMALRREFGDSRSAIKRIARVTRANERAVKNWYDGRNGPNAEFLIVLCQHSERVLELVLTRAKRADLLKAGRLASLEAILLELLGLIKEN